MSSKTTPTKEEKNVQTRPPVVVILGHVDHGKTSILDYIRKAKVAESESGGITQHTGAYQAEQGGKTITFIDTPGHEAFSAMRSRGARVADIAILVIAADDGVMPQTKEALQHIQKAGIPFIVAINKVDRPQADTAKVKNQLLEQGVTLEGYGGNVPNIEISAKTGLGIDDLLDVINLVAELEELAADPSAPVELVVVEAALAAQRGPEATLLVRKGTLHVGDIIAGSSAWARVKHMNDFRGAETQEALPSMPVSIIGFNTVPQVGERFYEVADQKEAEERIRNKQRKSEEGNIIAVEEGQRMVNIIIKADAEGTLEAVREVLRALETDELKLRFLQEGVGEITDSDVRLAAVGNGLVIGFRVKANSIARSVALNNDISLYIFSTIYELVEGVRQAVLDYFDPVVTEVTLGKFEVLKIFRTEPSKMIVGGKIVAGELRDGASLKVHRNGEEIGSGTLAELRSGATVVKKAQEGSQAGILFRGGIKLEAGDILEAFVKEKRKPSLAS